MRRHSKSVKNLYFMSFLFAIHIHSPFVSSLSLCLFKQVLCMENEEENTSQGCPRPSSSQESLSLCFMTVLAMLKNVLKNDAEEGKKGGHLREGKKDGCMTISFTKLSSLSLFDTPQICVCGGKFSSPERAIEVGCCFFELTFTVPAERIAEIRRIRKKTCTPRARRVRGCKKETRRKNTAMSIDLQ